MEAEVKVFASRMQLRPGMTLCEMGSANGALIKRLAPMVMPGGKLVATSINRAELKATAKAIDSIGLDSDAVLSTYLANDDTFAPGLADGTCDVLYSRMVIHMIPEASVAKYVPQWIRAMKPGGLMFMTDHNPMDGGPLDGPRRPIMFNLMPVIPQLTEIKQLTADTYAGSFELVDGPFEHPYYAGGYGAVYRRP